MMPDFGAMMPDTYHVPFPVELQGTSTEDSLGALAKLLKADLDPSRVAAVIMEAVQGEGGSYPACRTDAGPSCAV